MRPKPPLSSDAEGLHLDTPRAEIQRHDGSETRRKSRYSSSMDRVGARGSRTKAVLSTAAALPAALVSVVALLSAGSFGVGCAGASAGAPGGGWGGAVPTSSSSSSTMCAYGGLRPSIFVGERPGALVLADIDGDRRVDAIVARPDAHAVVVARGHGDGTFAEGVAVRVDGTPVALAVGDLDGDGRADVAVLEAGVPRVTVVVADRNGPRVLGSALLVGQPPSIRAALTVADVDGDGVADVLTTDANARALVLLRGLGRGALAPPRVVFAGVEPPRAIAVADFDGNRTTDIAVGASDGITFLAGDGRGSFAPIPRGSQRPPVPPDAPVALGVFPSAGRQRLVVRTDDGAHTIVGLGSAPIAVGGGADGRAAYAPLVVADLDRDGVADLIDVSPERSAIAVRRIDPRKLVPLPARTPGPGIDLDEPGVVDALRSQEDLPSGAPVAVAVADLSGDGLPDVASVGRDGFLGAAVNQGDGTFRPPYTFALPNFATTMAMADVDGDGDPDVVVSSAGDTRGGSITALLRRGESAVAVATPVRGRNDTLGVFDADGDGRRDVVSLVLDARGARSSVVVRRGVGGGRFESEGRSFPLAFRTVAAAYADVDGDGAVDVLVGARTGEVHLLRNARSGFLAPVVVGNVGGEVDMIAVDDLDGDRRPDIVVRAGTSQDRRLSILWGGAPGAPTFLPASGRFTIGRLGMRQWPDIVSASGAPVLRNGGRRSFTPFGSSDVIVGTELFVDDVDGDGSNDVLFGVGPDFAVKRGGQDGALLESRRYRLRPLMNVQHRPFVMTIEQQDDVKGIGVLRGTRGQAPAIVVATVTDVAILPRRCWRSP